MAGQVQVDTELMMATARQGANKATNMVEHAKAISGAIDFVQGWQGAAGDEFRTAMANAQKQMGVLIQKLEFVTEQTNKGAQGFSSQDASARSNLANQGQNFLSGKLNH